MSYRTRAEGTQIFGNGEYYPEWIEFIKKQGIEVDEDGAYEGNISDFMGAVVVIENIVLRLNKEREHLRERYKGGIGKRSIVSLFDFSETPRKLEQQKDYQESRESADPKYGNSLFDELHDIVENSYAFIPYYFYLACEDKLERDHIYTADGHFHCYKLKEGETIHVKAS